MKEMEVEYDFIPVDAGELSSEEWQQAGGQDALDILIEDHRKVQQLLKQFVKADAKQRRQLFAEIDKALRVHSKVEEQVVYPVLKRDDEMLADQSYTEHALVAFALNDIEKVMTKDPVAFQAKVKVLSELVNQHTKEEETLSFPEMRKAGDNTPQLAQQVIKTKERLMKQIKVPGAQATSTKSGARTTSKASSAASKPVAKGSAASKRTAGSKSKWAGTKWEGSAGTKASSAKTKKSSSKSKW